MRSELSGVDQDPAADGVDLGRQLVDRLHDARDIGGAQHGEQGASTGVLPQEPIEVVDVERAVVVDGDALDVRPGPPRKLVRMVLEAGRHDHRIGMEREGVSHLVDRLGRVLREHDDVAVRVGSHELSDDLPCLFEHRGGQS